MDSESIDECKVSFCNRIWVEQGLDLLDLKAQFIRSRNIGSAEQPTIMRYMPDPCGLPDVDALLALVLSSKKIGIFGDYDVDGITSVAIWVKFLEAIGINSVPYIPNRSDGYGVSDIGLQLLLNAGVDCILTLDCGTLSGHMFGHLKIPVAVIDHHQAKIGPNVPCVNPHRFDTVGQEDYKNLCTAGLSFLVIAKVARKYNFDAMSLLDLVTIGTVGDMMYLDNFNRACVRHGLQQLANNSNPGIQSILEILHIREVTSTTLAFYVIPTLNAAGRVGSAYVSLDLLMSHTLPRTLASSLISLNEQRKLLSSEMVAQGRSQVSQEAKALVLYDCNWHPGVVGIVAGQIADENHKPCFAMYKSGSMWKGSARAGNEQIDIGKVIADSVQAGLASSGGGHAAAGGVTVHEDMFTKWQDFIHLRISNLKVGKKKVLVDCVVSENYLLAKKQSFYEFGPFGVGNPRPHILIQSVWLRDIFQSEKYIKCTANSGGTIIALRAASSLVNGLKSMRGKFIDLLTIASEDGSILLYDARASAIP